MKAFTLAAIAFFVFSGSSIAEELVKNGTFSQDFTAWGHNRCQIENGVAINCTSVPAADAYEKIVNDPFSPNEKFLRMVRGDHEFQATYQFLGTLTPGKSYRLKMHVRTPVGSTISVNLYNKDWTLSDGVKTGKSFNRTVVSTTAAWQVFEKVITVPDVDAIGKSTAGNRWYLYLYSHFAPEFIEYDNVSLDTLAVPVHRANLLADAEVKATEKTTCWSNAVRADGTVEPIKLDQANTCASADSKFTIHQEANTTKLQFNGSETTRTKRSARYYVVNVKPDTLYRFSAKYQFQNRRCFDVMKFGENYTKVSKGITPILLQTEKERGYGISCGNIAFNLVDTSPDRMANKTALSRPIGVLSPRITDAPYIEEKNVEPFTETRDFRTGPNQSSMQIQFVIDGFDGTASVSEMKLIEATESQIAPTMLVSSTNSFGNMKLVDYVSGEQSHTITTTNGQWAISGNEIAMSRNGVSSGKIAFAEGILTGLTLISKPASLPSPGRIELSNDRIRLFFYSDSTLGGLLRKAQPVTITGLGGQVSRPHKTFDAGVAVELDLDQERGMFFSPMELNRLNFSLPEIHNKLRNDYKYPESYVHNTGYRFWEVNYNSTPNGYIWNKVTYHFKRLDTFMAAILPPKQFDASKICNERFHSIGVNFNELRTSADVQSVATQAKIDQFKSHFNIALFWMTHYSSTTDSNAPLYRYVDKRTAPNKTLVPPAIDTVKLCYSTQVRREGEEFLPNDSAYNNTPCKYALDRFSVRGRYSVPENRKALFQELIQKLNSQGIRVIVYLAPEFYYTTDVNKFVADLQALKSLGVEGFYFDGLYQKQAWKAREVVIRTRNLVGPNGFYAQHRSFENAMLPRSTHFRSSFLDAQASQLLVGEGVPLGLDGRSPPPSTGVSLWSVFYSGRIFSNTSTALLPELRPVRYIYEDGVLNHAESIIGSVKDTISPQAQINAQLAGGGAIYVPIVSSTNQITKVPFNDRILKNPDGSGFKIDGPLVNEYWRQFDQSCAAN